MRARTPTPIALAVLVALAVHPGPASADYLLTATGTFRSFDNETDRFDGTNNYVNDPSPLFDVDRLRGGTFTATYLYPDVVAYPTRNNATYNFGTSAGMSYILYDASGAAVHVGSSSSSPFALIFNDAFSPPVDQASFFAFVNDVTGLRIPSIHYGGDQALYAYQSGLVFSGQVSGSNDDLHDLGVPTDSATLLAFPNRTFRTGFEWDDGDVFGDTPYQTISTLLTYDITGVRVSAVPEPGSAALAVSGGAALVVAGWARRRRITRK
jgi:hypothetical protein